MAEGESVARVSALASGQLLLDGKPTDLHRLDAAFKELKEQQGAVWYYRENPQAAPPPLAVAVMKLVMRHRLPIRLFAKPDFSEAAPGRSPAP